MEGLRSMDKKVAERMKNKTITDFEPTWNCRFHPTNWWHENGCPHKAWGTDDLQTALIAAKKTNAYLNYIAFGIE